jgi:hypothetical protein
LQVADSYHSATCNRAALVNPQDFFVAATRRLADQDAELPAIG